MQVTIQFDSEQEQTEFLASVERYGFSTKEIIESALSSYLFDVVRSPILRSRVRREERAEALKKRIAEKK